MENGSVSAIRFHLDSGFVSELYGAPSDFSPRATFLGKHPGSRLVGIHGSYHASITKLGCTFASTTPPTSDSTAPFFGAFDSDEVVSKNKEEDENTYSTMWSTVFDQMDLWGCVV